MTFKKNPLEASNAASNASFRTDTKKDEGFIQKLSKEYSKQLSSKPKKVRVFDPVAEAGSDLEDLNKSS